MYSSFKNYTNLDIINFIKNQGLEVKEERGNRIFPVTDKSIDVLKCFEKRLKELNVKVFFENIVKKLIVENEHVVAVETNKQRIYADKVIIATGGKSFHLTGSTGDGYELAKSVGHTVTEIKPSLVPLTCFEKELCQEMQGLSLRNVGIYIEDSEKNKRIYWRIRANYFKCFFTFS